MLGWDVGYVWPLLEGVVVTQSQRPVDSWQLVMGNPREAAQRSSESGETSTEPSDEQESTDGSSTVPQAEPPPYESVTSESGFPDPVSVSRQSSAPNGDSHRTRQNISSRTRTNGSYQRVRPERWPHKASSVFACLCCVLGISNVSRFSVLVNFYKGCFIFQFLFLSVFIGIPFLYLQMSLGQYLGAGMLDMWYISPIFKGFGFAMLYLYILLGIYNALPLSWLFVYFKDSFITLKETYSWGKCHGSFGKHACLHALNSTSADYYGWSVPSYFHGRVLGRKPGDYQLGELKFEVAFYSCLAWIMIFICLSRGHKTFGRVMYVFGMVPNMLLLMVAMRMGQTWGDGISDLLSSSWRDTLIDPSSWWLAGREAFIIWGLFGTVALHICSHNKVTTNITKNLIAVAIIAVIILLSTAFLFSCAVNVFHKRELSLALSSYEEESSVNMLNTHIKVYEEELSVTGLLMGVSIVPKQQTIRYLSGYQVLRLVTETFPAALAVEGVRSISSFWSICFYTAMILLGIGQQLVMWYCIVESIISINKKVLKSWHTTLTFITCNIAFLLGLPMSSNVGIYIIYFLDYSISSLWWITLLYFFMLFAILFIRGRPYGTDQLVNVISRNPIRRSKILPFFTFMWNIVLPLSFLLLTISCLRSSSFDSSSPKGELIRNYRFWQPWWKALSYLIQIFPFTLVVTAAIYEAFKVFKDKKDKPFSEKLKLLCCPVVPLPPENVRSTLNSSSFSQGSANSGFLDDPPPKYTPPPSYSTATSRMIAKQLEKQREQERSNDCTVVDFDSLNDSTEGDSSSNTGSTTRIFQQPPRHEIQMAS